MIYFDGQLAPTLERSSDSVAIGMMAKYFVGEYGNDDRGYLVELTPDSNFRYIRFEPGVEPYRSVIYSSELEALEAIYYDQLSPHRSGWSKDWLEDLILAIADLKPLTPSCPRSRATARFAKRQLAIYGDAELGYIIGKTLRGKYRFIHYDGAGTSASPAFSTEFEALDAAYDDCIRRDSRHRGMPWAERLFTVVEEQFEAKRSTQRR